MAEIKSLSVRHNEIMDYLMANPTVKLGDVARVFNISAPWLSSVIHSDAFQNLLKEKQGIAFHHTILPLREKITHVAHAALDRLADQLPMEPEISTVGNIADKLLDKLGFGSKNNGGGLTINGGTVLIASERRAEVEEARRLMGQAQQTLPALEVHVDGQRTPIALPRESQTGMGQTYEHGTVYPETAADSP